jgi:hypothetical protein
LVKTTHDSRLLIRGTPAGSGRDFEFEIELEEIAMNRPCFVSSIVVAGALWWGEAHAVPQAFVHSQGSDLNVAANCTVAKPCRTFAAALTVADPYGEVVALDTEDFGPVTVTRSVAIIGNGRASIVVRRWGVGVNIPIPGVDVVLRGLNIDGVGEGTTGVSMKAGSSLAIENCVIANFRERGVQVTTAANVRLVQSVLRGNETGALIQGGATADVAKSQFIGNRSVGLSVHADTAGTTSGAVTDSVASGGLHGFQAGASHASGIGRMVVTGSMATHNTRGFITSASGGVAVLTVGYSTATQNSIGFAHFPGVAGIATFETLGNNIVRQNDTAVYGSIIPVAPM